MIKRTQLPVYVLAFIVDDALHNVIVISQGKIVIDLANIGIYSLAQIDHDRVFSHIYVLHQHLCFWEINVELIQTSPQLLDFLLKLLLFMEKLKKRVCAERLDQIFRLIFEIVHFVTKLVLLGEHVIPNVVKCVVEKFENLFHFELVIV